jgi:cytochrome c-type biogenesis protein CcmH
VAFFFENIGFWFAVGLIFMGSWLLVTRAFGAQSVDTSPIGFDLQLYKDQLTDLDKDASKGLLLPAEIEQLRLEVSRRILEAERKSAAILLQPQGPNAGKSAKFLINGALFVAFGGAIALYTQIGVLGYPDMGLKQRLAVADQIYASRPSQSAAEAKLPPTLPLNLDPEYEKLMQALRAAVAKKGGDIMGLTLLARNEANIGNFSDAANAMAQVINLTPAPGNALYIDMAEWMIFAASGYVSPQAETALRQGLALDPNNGLGRYYSGLMFIQIGRPDLAFKIWRGLIDGAAPDAPWLPTLQEQLPNLARLAGQKYEAPTLKGPNADDIAAAADMSVQDRQTMIATMVDGLRTRLAETGGTPDEWARLISAYGVLGQKDDAKSIYDEATVIFAADPAAMDKISTAAQSTGLLP